MLIAFSIAVTVDGRSVNSFYRKYNRNAHFESVNVGPGLFAIAKLFKKHMDPSERELISAISSIKILTTESSASPQLQTSFNADFEKVVQRGNYESLLEVREKNERVRMLIKQNSRNITDLLIMVSDSGELNLIWIKGKITRDKIEKLANKYTK